MLFRVNVTKEIYRKSMYCGTNLAMRVGEVAHQNCAIAKAIHVLFPNTSIGTSDIVFVKDINGSYHGSNHIGNVELPNSAKVLIHQFDSLTDNPEGRLDLPEVSFEIDVPDEMLEQIVDISEITNILKDCKTLELIS